MTEPQEYKLKNLSNVEKTITVANPDTDTLSMYESVIRELYGFSKEEYPKLTFVQSGKVLDVTKTFASTVSHLVHILFMAQKTTKPVVPSVAAPTPAPIPVPTPPAPVPTPVETFAASDPVSSTDVVEAAMSQNTSDRKYSTDQVHASLPAFFMFVAQNPEMMTLFNSSPQDFISVLTLPVFKILVSSVMEQTTHILSAMENGGNVGIAIPTLQGLQSASTGPGPQTTASNMWDSHSEATLTEEDEANIMSLIGLGFPRNEAVTAYRLCNKNMDHAAALLFDNRQ